MIQGFGKRVKGVGKRRCADQWCPHLGTGYRLWCLQRSDVRTSWNEFGIRRQDSGIRVKS
jgi:hypothetical protein